MTKTTFDQVTVLYELLKNSIVLASAITGEVHRKKRPPGSTKEDVVVNSLPILEGSIQLGYANVNIHVPDIQRVGETGKYYVSNDARLDELLKIVYPIIQNGIIPGNLGQYMVTMQSDVMQDTINQSFVNFRVLFRWHHSQY